ncbi:UNVERIFIED_CONTAM: hypothetical protein GTU68_008555 [Idotea baltica]|nr:hypothetical protein [Idotea baltica]
MEQLTCAIVQYDIQWHDPEHNFQICEDYINEVSANLIVLPEMFNTGFSNDVQAISEPMDGPTVTWMLEVSAKYGRAVCGSLVIKEKDKYYNRFILVHDGQTLYVDKRHLFSMGGEDKRFTAASSRGVITYKSWRLLPIICYDLRFPVWCRNDINYDALLCVANWPAVRIHHWDRLLMARAIENQSYVIACNRVGVDGHNLSYPGHSQVIDPMGQYINSPEDRPGVLTADLSKSYVHNIRQKYPFSSDRDPFNLSTK